MLDTASIAVEKVVETLEQMAFITVMPAETPPPAPSRALLVSLDFGGPVAGRLELLAGEGLGLALAANILGASPDDPDAQARAIDALKELVNMTTGSLLSAWPDLEPGSCRMTIPQIKELTPEQWNEQQSGGFVMLDAEGNALGIRMIERNG